MSQVSRNGREVLLYLIFGVLTTLVGAIVYFGTLLGGRALLQLPAEDVTSTSYFIVYTAAQLLQWLCAALFSFFTNRAWVFTDADKNTPIFKQMLPFFGGRVITLGLEYLITWGATLGLVMLIPVWAAFPIGEKECNLCEILAKLIAAVVVIVTNFFISKIFVFKKKQKT